MRRLFHYLEYSMCLSFFVFTLTSFHHSSAISWGSQSTNGTKQISKIHNESEIDFKTIPFKIVFETYRETNGRDNWELYLINADGRNEFNLTQTPEIDEMYPHVSPDGTKICFVTHEKGAKGKVRSIYYMNVDGSDRVKVADYARWPCWSSDSRTIAYLKDEYHKSYSTRSYSTKGLFFYELTTRVHKQHPNEDLHHLYNVCWSPDDKWFFANVVGGMGFGSAIVAIEAQGNKMFDLTKYGIKGCRPDFCFNGRVIGWANSNEIEIYVADIDLTLPLPRIANLREVAKCQEGYFINHADFSPDGQYITFSSGPAGNYEVGRKSPDWNIYIGNLKGNWIQITTDGKHNKEPDWVPIINYGKESD